MEVSAARLDRAYMAHEDEYNKKALDILRSGRYIMDKELAGFEQNFAKYIGSKYCVGLASGLDSLWIAFRLLGIGAGDEVIVQGNTFIGGVIGISATGAVPAFAEPDNFFCIDPSSIEARITKKTKAILVTHLYGMMTPMDKITEICKKHGLLLVEDCAQAHGASYKGKKAGSFGDVSCFSFYPTKNLGGFGDGGAIVTNNALIADEARVLRNYGSEKKYFNKIAGANSRLDELQAGLLNIRLKYLDEMNAERNLLAERYSAKINNRLITLPEAQPDTYNIWHQYVIRCNKRDELQKYLQKHGIHTIIHYPIPPHLSEAYAHLGLTAGDLPITEELCNTVLSLPMYNGMTADEQQYVIANVNNFCLEF